MSKKPIRILAVNPGTRYIGVAVFEGQELIDWRVRVFRGKWSKKKLQRIKMLMCDTIDRHGSDVLAIKKLRPCRSSKNLNRLISVIKQLSKKRGLKAYQYSIKDLKAFYSPAERINKRKLAQLLAFKYPALWYEFNRERKNKNPYYTRVFEAAAIGEVCAEQLDKN